MAKPEEPNKVIYSMVGVGKVHGTKQVLKDIYLGYFYGAKIGVIGLNGSGKSTLLRIMAGAEKEFIGEVAIAPGYSVGFLEQEPRLDPTKTVLEVVKEGVHETADLLAEFEAISDSFAEPMEPDEMEKLLARQGEVQEKLDALDAWDLDSRLELAMDALRCPPGETPIKVLSGGELRRVALCRLLLAKPDILLLDEPTNHLDAESVAWLEQHLRKYEGTVIAVTHDRYFLDNVAGWILELDRGQGIPWKGNYSSWLQQKQERLRQEQKQESERVKTLQRELEWIHMAPKARHAKGKARINAYQQLLTAKQEEVARDLEIYVPPGPRLGDVVIEAKGLRKGFGEKLLMEDASFLVPPAAIVGVIGPNGAGKTTLARMIIGEEKPDAGTLRLGETVQLAYVDQSRTLDPEKTVYEVISEGHGRGAARQGQDERPRLLLALCLLGGRPAEEGLAALRRRAQPGPPRAHAQGGRQRPAPRRAHQRPRRQHPARPRGRPRAVRGLRRGDLPRPLVPRPHRDPHPRLRGRQQGHVLRWKLLRVRGVAQADPRRRRNPPAPDHVQEADEVRTFPASHFL